MKPNYRKKALKFGGFITAAHDASDGQPAERDVEPTMPLKSATNAVQMTGHEAGFPVRLIAKLCGAIASHVPAGYEDETGFHYGANVGDWFFLIFDSGVQPFFQRGSSPPPPWRLPPESVLGFQKRPAEAMWTTTRCDFMKISTQGQRYERSA